MWKFRECIRAVPLTGKVFGLLVIVVNTTPLQGEKNSSILLRSTIFIMKRLGYKKRRKKIHPANQCSVCSNYEDEYCLTSSSRRAREKVKIRKEIQDGSRSPTVEAIRLECIQ